jgi:hypothetical protein
MNFRVVPEPNHDPTAGQNCFERKTKIQTVSWTGVLNGIRLEAMASNGLFKSVWIMIDRLSAYV